MHVTNTHRKCIAAMGSMTATVKAQRVLLDKGIQAEVIALAPEDTRRGCAYGLEFACHLQDETRTALRAARITPSQYIDKG